MRFTKKVISHCNLWECNCGRVVNRSDRQTDKETDQMLLSGRFHGQFCKSAGLLVPCESTSTRASVGVQAGRRGGGLTVRRLSGSLRVMGGKTSVRGVERERESVALCSSSSSLSHNRNVQC